MFFPLRLTTSLRLQMSVNMAIVWGNLLILVFAHVVVSQRYQCGKPIRYPDTPLDEKFLDRSVFNDGDKVFYKCPLGYSLSSGSRMSLCKGGSWKPLTMTCQKKKCLALGDIENGYYQRGGQSFGDIATAVCNKGYVLRGERVRICLPFGWNGTDPICEVSKSICSAPDVANRWIKPGERTQYSVQDTVTITCSEGFDLIGSSVVTCGPDGQWLKLPQCRSKGHVSRVLIPSVLKTCPTPDLGKSGTVKELKSVYIPGDSLSIICNEGFIGSGDFTCHTSEKWIPKEPKCQKINCPTPAVVNGRIRGARFQYKYEDIVEVICNEGFDLDGPSQVTCGPGGQWQGLPKCRPKRISSPGHVSRVLIPSVLKTCPTPDLGKSGTVKELKSVYVPGDSLSIICNEGFDLDGPSQVTCGPGGQWQGLPKCRPKRISSPGKCGPAPSHLGFEVREGTSMLQEYPSGFRIRYRCGVGHRRASGSDSIRCSDSGQWTKLNLQCERKRCGSAGEISFGRFEYTGVLFGDSAKAICQEGYELVGPQMRTCRDGGWDGRIPDCEPVHCPPPPEVNNAEMSYPINDYVPFGQVVSYRCRTGVLIGAREIHCTQRGTWSAPPPECKDSICPHPRVPYGSRMRGVRSVYKAGNTLIIACDPSFRLIGENFVTCGPDGEWKPKLPECERWYRRVRN